MHASYNKALERFLQQENIAGVSIGLRYQDGRWTNQQCISFRVKEKKPTFSLAKKERIPKKLAGVPTDVIQGVHRPLLQVSKIDPLRGGTSIGQEEALTVYGTLGAILFDQKGIPYGLTNYHVVVPPGEIAGYVIQPAGYDSGVDVVDRIGEVSDYNIDANGDFAIIPINTSKRGYDPELLSDLTILEVRAPVVGDAVKKIGRTTDTTTGVVSSVGTFAIDYSLWGLGTINMLGFEFIPTGDPNDTISAEGDSGACVYVEAEGAALGILTASFTTPSVTFASLMTSACDLFDLRIIQQRSRVKVTNINGEDRLTNFINLGWTAGEKTLTVDITLGDDYLNLFLYVDAEYFDLLEAKLSTESDYMAVGAYARYPTCVIGNITKNTPISINFRFNASGASADEQNIMVNVGYDCQGMIRGSDFGDFFWIGDLS